MPEADRHFAASMAQILRDTNTKVPKWLNNMETSSRQGYETPTKVPAPSERRAELARVLVLSGELKHQPACLGAYTLVAGGAVHGRPVWRHERGDRCIAKLASGKWAVQKEENVGVQMVSAFCACSTQTCCFRTSRPWRGRSGAARVGGPPRQA